MHPDQWRTYPEIFLGVHNFGGPALKARGSRRGRRGKYIGCGEGYPLPTRGGLCRGGGCICKWRVAVLRLLLKYRRPLCIGLLSENDSFHQLIFFQYFHLGTALHITRILPIDRREAARCCVTKYLLSHSS